jgi:hypothetical protein
MFLFIVVVATLTVITRYKNEITNQVANKQQNVITKDL